MQAMISPLQRHRVLASATRSGLLATLRRAGRPFAVRELAVAHGLHPNSVREQLALLVEAGLVVREVAPPAGRGRPSLRYRARADDDAFEGPAYRVLAGVLADQLARLPDATSASLEAGVRWGRSMIAGTPGATVETDAVDRLVELLDQAGFAPEAPTLPGEPIRLHHCPFENLARERGNVICGVHLGLMRGALAELGAPIDAVGLDPFVRPDLCVAHLGARTDG